MVYSLIGVATLKTELGITDTADDARLRRIAEATTRSIDEFCHRTFHPYASTNRYTYRPHPDPEFCGALLLPDDLLSITTLKTLTDSTGGTRTYGDTWGTADYDLYPDNAPQHREPYWAIYENPDGAYAWPRGRLGVQIAGVWGYWLDLLRSTATLAEDLDTSETGVDVSSGTVFDVGQTLLIDSEQVYVTGISTNTLTVERGQNGTTAATHSNGAAIDVYRYPRPVVDACILQCQQANHAFESGGAEMAGGGSFGTRGVWTSRVPAGLHPNIRNSLEPFVKRLVV